MANARTGGDGGNSGTVGGVTGNGGFCGALQRSPPSVPPALARRLTSKECYGVGKVKVMLRVPDRPPEATTSHCLALDKKRRQVTLTEPKNSSSTCPERGPMVAAPKMFAFDHLFTADDKQSDVCASALGELIPAVLEGNDGCLLAMGYPGTGQQHSVLGDLNSLGALPCAIAWLYKGINERRRQSGARFSVRVSAVGVSANRPDAGAQDLLVGHAAESDDSPGIYLRDDFLGGPTELRAPSAERAALFLDAALAGRNNGGGSGSGSGAGAGGEQSSPALVFTLHVYQYSLSRKGGVAGGRSRLHIIDLGGCANRGSGGGGLPLSGIGNILLAILSGQRHPPHKDHPLQPLLKDCLAPITCHVSVLAHVRHDQSYQDTLSTIQIASRIHRLRRRKHRVPMPLAVGLTPGITSAGSSADPSSSEISADTVIYMGPHHDDATDGEHPPVYLPSLSAGDNRGVLAKALKGSAAEKQPSLPGTPKKSTLDKGKKLTATTTASLARHSPLPSNGTTETPPPGSPLLSSFRHLGGGPIGTGGLMCSKGSNVPTPKGSPMRRNLATLQGVSGGGGVGALEQLEAGMRKITEEQWIDGPRVSRAKVAEARHLMREVNHVKQCETWVDGPKSLSCRSLTAGNLPPTAGQSQGYGFMDAHKKTMIRQWVENQTSQVFQSASASCSPATHLPPPPPTSRHLAQLKQKSLDLPSMGQMESHVYDNLPSLTQVVAEPAVVAATMGAVAADCDEDEDSGPSEVPPALPLLEPLGSRDVSHDSLQRMLELSSSRPSRRSQRSIDCGLQVTEEEIARTMANCEKKQPGDDTRSFVSSFNMVCESFSECGEHARHQFDQLARLHEIFTSQLAMAEVTPAACLFRTGGCDVGSVYSEPAFRFSLDQGSVCSEPAYRLPSPKQPSHSPSQGSLPSLNGIMEIAVGMEEFALLRQPDGASDPSLPKSEKRFTPQHDNICEADEQSSPMLKLNEITNILPLTTQHQQQQQQSTRLPLLPLNNTSSEAYDSGHDSSTPRTSKHSGMSRRAESGYHSVATVRDSDESSFASGMSKKSQGQRHRITVSGNYQRSHKKPRHEQHKGLCNWLLQPFSCTYPETEGEISDF